MSYIELDVVPDSPEWYEKRREGLGASDSAAILGHSKWGTPLDVYKSKVGGVEREFDALRAFVGHESEQMIRNWIQRWHPEVGRVFPARAVQSVEWPWLFATPDGTADDVGLVIPVELKTSNRFARDNWLDRDGIPAPPLYYQVQAQQQIAVLGAPYGWLAVHHGDTDFELFKIERDEVFIEQLVRITGEWWEKHVVARVAPDPSTYAEANEAFPGVPELTYTLTQEQFELIEQRDVAASDMNHTKRIVESFKDYIGPLVGDATVLEFEGRPRWSFKRQNGGPQVRLEQLRTEFPEAYEATVYTPRFPVLRKIKQKEDA